MKAKDFRIGNYVEYDYPDTGWDMLQITLQDIEDLEDGSFRPITATDELLSRLGVESEYTTGGFLRWSKGSFKLLDRRLPYPSFHSPDATIIYVHQLQNLYYSIMGEELYLKP